MAECVRKLPKPVMKGLLKRQITINLCVAIGLSLVGGGLFKYFVCEGRKKKFEEFYREYDPDKTFLNMLKMGADFTVGGE